MLDLLASRRSQISSRFELMQGFLCEDGFYLFCTSTCFVLRYEEVYGGSSEILFFSLNAH